MAQKITPELLQLRQRDHDMHKVLKVALQPWPTLAGREALTEFGGEPYLLFFSNWQVELFLMLRDLIFIGHMVEVSPICLHMGR